MTPIDDAAEAVRRGELIVFPTDTVYGIATRPDDPSATARLFEAKRRARELSLPVLVTNVDVARTLARFDDRADRLCGLWPGALTIVLPRTDLSRSWELGADAGTIGLRVPRHPLALAVLLAAGPLATTSANLSSAPPARTCDDLHEAFGDSVAVYLCEDAVAAGVASTVVDLAHGGARIVRAGGVDERRLEELLGEEVPLLDSPPSG
ncbi:MAG: L-threonylcarbamoyladenylate synthase [Actinomycetota bacterium]